MQYWAEKLNLPEICPLARSAIEFRERVKEHITLTKWDVIQGLGRVNPGATSQWPQTSSTSLGRMEPPLGNQPVEQDTSFMEETTQTASPAMSSVELSGPITPPDRMEEENWYVLVVTASIWQLNLETADVDLGESVTALPGRDAFWNPCMVAVFLGPTRRAISSQGTTVKELEE